MSRMYQHVVYVQDGHVFNSVTERVVNTPAFILDLMTGTFHGWGEADYISQRFHDITAKLSDAGHPVTASSFVYVEMGDAIPVNMQVYVLRRLLEYSATRFGVELYEQMQTGKAVEWLDTEMLRLPIALNMEEEGI